MKKQFGQNFLRTERFAKLLIEAAKVEKGDYVIEIGPGEGVVTKQLLEAEANVLCVEIDYDLLPNLIRRFNETPGFQIVHMDIMKVNHEEALKQHYPEFSGKFKVVGSLPYNISKQIIAKFATAEVPPEKMAFIIQEEVAQEYVGSNFLGNWIRLFSIPKNEVSIPRTQFYPVPQVDGRIITFTPKQVENAQELTKLLRTAYSSPRKTLSNNLSNIYPKEKVQQIIADFQLSPTIRAAEVPFEKWQEIYAKLS